MASDKGYDWPKYRWDSHDQSKEWDRFQDHCNFVFAGRFSKATGEEKVGNFMSFMGDRGREIFRTFTFENETVRNAAGQEEERSKRHNLQEVMRKFEEYFSRKRNEVMGASLLEKRVQQPNERFEDFYTDLLLLVKSCGFCENDSTKLVRNAIALRARDKEVRENAV
jgi:hypothetical protein